MKTKTIKLPTIDKIDFEVIVTDEHIPIKGNAIASGDDDFDLKVENELTERLNCGDIWAWCCVEVKGTYKSLSASDFLGGCSYLSKKDFEEGGYFEDMKQTVFNEIITQLKEL